VYYSWKLFCLFFIFCFRETSERYERTSDVQGIPQSYIVTFFREGIQNVVQDAGDM
jgi:hypothetical protein